jgi:hypothetical protein
MAMRCFFRSMAALITAATVIAATPAAASRHRRARTHSHTRAEHHRRAAITRRHAVAVRRDKTMPAGVTTVPAGGLKVYCPARSPLLIRKATQGGGTTVTVICR